MNVVDSSGWLEYLADGTNASFFAPSILDGTQLLVPSICVYEVFKKVLQQRDEAAAVQAIIDMSHGRLIELERSIAISAARLSHQHKVPMADSIIYATAQAYGATLWTQDGHLKDLPRVKYTEKK
jgi:toxin FitB